MRKNLTLFVFAVAVLMMFATACKKDSKSPQEMIMGKWNLDTYAWHDVDQGDVDEGSEDVSATGYYFDFRNDAKLYMYFDGDYDTLTYNVVDAKTLVIDGETIELSTFNEKNLSLYFKQTGTDYVYEMWYNFKK